MLVARETRVFLETSDHPKNKGTSFEFLRRSVSCFGHGNSAVKCCRSFFNEKYKVALHTTALISMCLFQVNVIQDAQLATS